MSFWDSIGGIVQGITGGSSKPYDKAMQEYQKWINQAQGTQQPYLDAGKGAIGNYQNWLQGQQDPSKFINNLMGGYQESPYAKYQQQQAMNAGTNFGSANGLSGSTPLLQQMQQNAGGIASQDQNQWLQNVLGINTQYGQGQNNLMQGGQNAANQLTNLYGQAGQNMGQAAYGRQDAKNNDFWSMFNGIGSMFGW